MLAADLCCFVEPITYLTLGSVLTWVLVRVRRNGFRGASVLIFGGDLFVSVGAIGDPSWGTSPQSFP